MPDQNPTPVSLLFFQLPVPGGMTPWRRLCLFNDGGDGYQTGFLDPMTRKPKSGIPGHAITIQAVRYAELPHFSVITNTTAKVTGQ